MLEQEIVKLGLSDKEARVYLASLELGSATAQVISEKAGVNRATTYVIIASLMDMGIMSTFGEGKKTFFSAEPPERLLEFLRDEEKRVNEKIELLKEKMPELNSIANANSDKPKIKYFEGIEGLRAVQSDFIESMENGDTIYTFLPYDHFYQGHLAEKVAHVKNKRIEKDIHMDIIYSSKLGRQMEYESMGKELLRQDVFIPYDKYPFDGGMNIYGNKIFMIDYTGKTGGLVIENKALAKMMKQLFKIAWQSFSPDAEK